MHDVSCCLILMMLLVLLLTSCAIGPSTKGSSLHNPAQRVFLVRHAERFNDSREDPPLTAEGKERAKALADMLRDAGVSAIITSQWIRAKDTAQPLADLLKITPEVIPTVDPPHEYFQATANAVRRIRNDTVLVVGHITIPNIIAELDGPQLPTICESVFSDLFLLVPALGWDGLTRLRYGAAENISSGCRNLPEFLRPDSN
ncbi:MAG TPA: histidine phosphatase family protein [Candidatus Binatia bacterium]|jgi:phosphohistidine phosphatase SixA